MPPAPPSPSPSAWTNPAFRNVWAALTVSLVGTQVTTLALPLLAALTLQATPQQMGALAASELVPWLLFSLFTGAWVDHIREKRVLMIWMDVLRAVLLLSIPITASLHLLTFAQLYVVAFTVGTMRVFYEVAEGSYVPSILSNEQILDGNSRLQVSYSAAGAAGPGIGGLLVQWLGAPVALIVDTLSYLVSAYFLGRIRILNPQATTLPPLNLLQDVQEGLRFLLTHPLLGPWAIWGTPLVFFTGAFDAQYILFLTRELHLNAGWIGLIAAAGGAAALAAAFLTTRLAQWLPVGPTILLGNVVWIFTLLVVPFLHGSVTFNIGVLALARIVFGLTFTVANVQQWSLRQLVTPPHLRGRVSASYRFLVNSGSALGAVAGGLVAARLGLRVSLIAFCVCALVFFIPLFFKPIWQLKTMPQAAA